jgi:Xaa-Pro dipeptidase
MNDPASLTPPVSDRAQRRPLSCRRHARVTASAALAMMLLAGGCGVAPPAPSTAVPQMPALPSWSEQMRVRESWLPTRHALMLEMMRRHDIDMWIIVNEEFHNDPITQYIAPPRPYSGNRDIFVFVDAGQDGLKKYAITGFPQEQVRRHFESPRDPVPATTRLPELYARYTPARIGLNMGGRKGVQRSLTHDSYLFLEQTLGPEAASRFVSAADLLEEFFETRIPEELEYYRVHVEATDVLARRALSNEVITPGRTTVGEVRNWLYDEIGKIGAGAWFQPNFRIYERGVEPELSRGFPIPADESKVIERGQVVHLDLGITRMGFDTDWQKNAYVLREGETDAPEGLTRALANANALQDALMLRAARPGRTAGEVTARAMEEMSGKGFEPRIYSHPIGAQGHGLGTSLGYGFRADSKGDPATMTKRLRDGSYISIELCSVTAIPEWDGQQVIIGLEDPAHLTDEGYQFFVPRQEAFYLIR